MLDTRLFLLQRATAVLMAPLVLIHLALIIVAVRNGLDAAEILSRTRGSWLWGSYYSLFVIAASIHAAIGLRVIGTVLVTICFATGRPELNRRASLLRAVALVALIVPMVSAWGTLGAALALLGSGVVWVCFNLGNMRRIISLSIPQYVSSMSGGFGLSALIMAIWMLIPR